MALPTTISGIALNEASVGPFISSGGNVYFFGKDSTTGSTLQAYKATDPTSSFSSVATDTGFSTAIRYIAGCQNSDVIHLAVVDGASPSINLKYRTFNMATDAFVTSETVHSAYDSRNSATAIQYNCSIIFRASDSQPIIFYNGPNASVMGTSYARVVYARRTAVNTWTTNVAVDAAGSTDWVMPEAILGSSNRAHFFWYASGVATVNQRALNSSSVLQTASTAAGGLSSARFLQAVSYDASGTQKIAVLGSDGTNVGCIYFDSADSPTLNVGTEYTGTEPQRLFNDGTDVWALYRKAADSDLYVRKSTDHGATFGSEVSAFTGTVSAETISAQKLSVDGNIFQRGGNYVIPYVVNDNGTLKYNEYTARTTAGAVALSGSNGVTFANTGNVGLARPVVAANTASFANTATLGLARPLSAANAVAFSNTATLTQTRPLSASNAVAFANAGTLQQVRPLAGSNAVAFAESGVLGLARPLSGSNAVAFADTAALNLALGLSASNAIAFINAGTLTTGATVDLSASNTVTFTSAPVLGLARPLSVGNTLTFANSGAINVTLGLSATNALSFANTALLGLARPLSGTNAVAFTDVGTLNLAIGLAGQNAAAFDNSGNLSVEGQVDLSGVNAAAFANAATLTLSRPLSAANVLAFANSGALGVTVALEGSAGLAFDGAASLTVEAAPVDQHFQGAGSVNRRDIKRLRKARRKMAEALERQLRALTGEAEEEAVEATIAGVPPPEAPALIAEARATAVTLADLLKAPPAAEMPVSLEYVQDLMARLEDFIERQDEEEVLMLLAA